MLLNTWVKTLSSTFAINSLMKSFAVKLSPIGIGLSGQLSLPKLLVCSSIIFTTVLPDIKFLKILKLSSMNSLKSNPDLLIETWMISQLKILELIKICIIYIFISFFFYKYNILNYKNMFCYWTTRNFNVFLLY